MPLVHIDLVEGRSDEQLALLADTVYKVERDVFSAPEDDRYIIITEHKPGRMSLGSTGLGYQRSSEAMVIQITEQSRDRYQKEALYRTLAEQLHTAIGLRPEDLIVPWWPATSKTGRSDSAAPNSSPANSDRCRTSECCSPGQRGRP
jgi:phenylpyruvate tautomerase PptA (4-oxalocrotonate tautomerase family)